MNVLPNRPLGRMETALTLTNEFAPLSLVGVVQVAGGPTPEGLRRALDAVQARHPLLRARLVTTGRQRLFKLAGNRRIALRVVPRLDAEQWQLVAEAELNARRPVAEGPLLNAVYVHNPDGPSELILSAHHAILDGTSALALWDELLALCGGEALPTATNSPDWPPPAEALYPPAMQGLAHLGRLLGFMAGQMTDEVSYRRGAHGAPAINLQAQSKIRPQRLSAPLTAALIRRCRAERVTVNSALSAAMLLAVRQARYGGAATALRGVTFGNLRPYLKPPPALTDLGCYITMLRYTTPFSAASDVWSTARVINQRIYQAARRGDKFAAAWLSPLLVDTTQRLKTMRLAVAALSYTGVATLREQYGPLRVLGLHGFVSNHGLGAEYAAAARLFRNEIWWDALYLDTDMDAESAQAIGVDLQARLQAAV